MSAQVLLIGTRGSALALAQTARVVRRLERAHPGLRCEVRVVSTAGDRDRNGPLATMGGRGVFVTALENALLAGEVDAAVHSLKDVPTEVPDELMLAAFPERADPHDVLVSLAGWRVEELPRRARVGTGSARRRGQLLYARPDVQVLPIRGNVETRVAKMLSGQYDAVVLARAGLVRLGRPDGVGLSIVPFELMLPAAGQGTLVVEARREDQRTRRLLTAVGDGELALVSQLERQVLAELGAGCHGAVGVLARVGGGEVLLRAVVAAPDGSALVRAKARGTRRAVARTVRDVLGQLRAAGAEDLISRSREG